MTKSKILILFVIAILFSCSSTKKEKEKPLTTSERALELKAEFSKSSNGRYIFTVLAKRLRSDSLERFPSSEHIRLFIYDKNGTNVWRTDNKIAYSSQITYPEPDTIGKTHKYFIDWDGNDNNNNILKTGRYRADLMLPIMPKPYIVSIEFDWKNPYD